MLKFPGSLNLSFHNLSIHQFSRKNPSLAQFIPRIYNKIIIKKFYGIFGALHLLYAVYILKINKVGLLTSLKLGKISTSLWVEGKVGFMIPINLK